jgi:hypothetical protein
MSLSFGTENLIFVPEGGRLRVWDLHSGLRLELDTRHGSARLRPRGLEMATGEITLAVAELQRNRATRANAARYQVDAARVLDSLGTAPGAEPRRVLPAFPAGFGATWWIRLSDAPVESFFPEDYAEADALSGPPVALPVYGSLHVKCLEDLDVPLPIREDEAPLWLLLPERGGYGLAPFDPLEPLPLTAEFCGSGGVSARGNSVNLRLDARIATEHQGCTPLREVAPGILATLYFHLESSDDPAVCARLASKHVAVVRGTLADSGFRVAAEGPDWTILERKGYAVHLYDGLEGRESAGVPRLPAFLYVASASGSNEPAARADLLQQIVELAGT